MFLVNFRLKSRTLFQRNKRIVKVRLYTQNDKKEKKVVEHSQRSHSHHGHRIKDKVPMIYDLCVIGGGPAGFAGATRAWDFGKNVCVVEKSRLGGAGIHAGALSSKTMWEISEDFKVANSQRRGYFAQDLQCNFCDIKNAVFKAQEIKESQMKHQLDSLAIPVYNGTAKFISSNQVVIQSNANEDFIIQAKNFLIATGSKPRTLPDLPEDGKVILTSDTIMNLREFPQTMVILGAGVIGCEYTTVFSNFKKTKVYMIDKADRILPFEDQDISELISSRMERKNVTIHHKAQLIYMKKKNGRVEYCLEYPDKDIKETHTVDVALLSIGRIPNTEKLNLEAAGVELDERGSIKVNNIVNTNRTHIKVVGDASPGIALVNVAELESRFAIELMFNPAAALRNPVRQGKNLSTIMFLDPKVSSIGANESQLQKQKIEYKLAVYHYSLIGRAIAKGKPTGYIKVLVTNDDEMKILGVRALGQHSSTVVDLASFLIEKNESIYGLGELVTGYPSMTEAFFECVRLFTESSIMKPKAFKDQTRLVIVTYDDNGEPLYSNIMVPGIRGKPKKTPRTVKGWPISMEYASWIDRE